LCFAGAIQFFEKTQPRVDTVKKIVLILLFLLLACVIPAAVFAAEGGESGWGWWETIGRWVNLLVLFGVIFYFTRGFITKFFADRRGTIRTEIEEAEAARKNAEAELEEMKQRMAGLDQELADMQRQAEEKAAKERERIEAEAKAEAEKIISSVKGEVDGLMRSARDDLKSYAGELAVDLAAKKIRGEMDEEKRRQVVNSFLDDLAETKGGER